MFVGFLSTGDANSPGNYGILDQSMALRWVYENIEFFNGDRESITLFGPDAGAASAGLLMTNPRTRDIVTRVIAQVKIFLQKVTQKFVVGPNRVSVPHKIYSINKIIKSVTLSCPVVTLDMRAFEDFGF